MARGLRGTGARRLSTLVVGDVHGCADELAELVAHAGADRVVLIGDLFTKGPDPAGVWAQIRDGGFEAVLGNHDARVLAPRAGDVGALRTAAVLDAADPRWRAWTSALPLFRAIAGWTVVHAGVHPSGELGRTSREMALSMRRWPRLQDPTCPYWHAVYRGARRVVFGHDAVRGLVRVERDGQLQLVGLDTGCVYGGALTGLCLEDQVLARVAARSAYRRF